ncbi:protein-tyrosine-phosphatase [Rhodocytophaga aerolata]|uniref:Protein-tyrosine-phosphatase n=2 Tax=Rhodocytophaga aerolata TaxID=455078 RepID=A0ABT8RA69_9BACT|nr:protein-tyrosine-phosphatase [Rhodocytophaga aerolata]MDO1447657.1 protein-tyrosine-phosphatase [Rhodocytophaga aerolata]
MSEKPTVLVVCGRNKRRSRTAEYIFKNDMRFSIRSAGLSPKSDRQLSEKDITWADIILVMERSQKARIVATYRHIHLPTIEVLHIADVYDYLDSELIELLTEKINAALHVAFSL